MKSSMILMLLLVLISCGSKKDAGPAINTEAATPASDPLSASEAKLAAELLEVSEINQEVLLKKLLLMDGLDRKSFERLDKVLTIICSESQKVCRFTTKGNL